MKKQGEKRRGYMRWLRLGLMVIAAGLIGQGSVSFWSSLYAASVTNSGSVPATTNLTMGLRVNIVAVQRLTLDCANSAIGSAPTADLQHDFTDLTADTNVTTTTAHDDSADDSAVTGVDGETSGAMAVYTLACTLTQRCAGSASCASSAITAALNGGGIRAVLFPDGTFSGTQQTVDLDSASFKGLSNNGGGTAFGATAIDLDASTSANPGGADILANSPGSGTNANALDIGVAVSENDSAGAVTGVITFALTST